MTRIDDRFPELLDGIKLETLEADPGTVFGMSADLLLLYLNPAWFTFASENGGEPEISDRFSLGTRVADAIAGELRGYYVSAFDKTLRLGKVWHHDYECSSPDRIRIYHQAVYPLAGRLGLLVVNSQVREPTPDPRERAPHDPERSLYLQKTGLITQCSNCRRTQRAAEPDSWDWVPAWVECMPENVSHSLCKICFEYYYSDKALRWEDRT